MYLSSVSLRSGSAVCLEWDTNPTGNAYGVPRYFPIIHVVDNLMVRNSGTHRDEHSILFPFPVSCILVFLFEFADLPACVALRILRREHTEQIE